MTQEFVVKRIGLPWEAEIFLNAKKQGKMEIGSANTSTLTQLDGEEWTLSPKIGAHFRPFSIVAIRKTESGGKETLRITEGLFRHKNNFYMCGAVPEGIPPRGLVTGVKFVCRLDTFPFESHAEIDSQTLHKMRRMQRGIPVGEIYGIGSKDGSHIKVENELEDIGLPLSAALYMIYSTA